MQLTKEQFYNYIKEHGITKAELTKSFLPRADKIIQKGTILYFGLERDLLSTYDECTENKNRKLNFSYEWDASWREYYKGKFKIIPEYAPTPVAMNKIESKIITKIKSLTAKINKLDEKINKLIEML